MHHYFRQVNRLLVYAAIGFWFIVFSLMFFSA
jgi:hypothetical protein